MRKPSKKDEQRFFEKVRKTSGCWLWTASVDSKGFGQLGFTGMQGGLIKAARFSWLLHKGRIPAKHKVRQSCGNKLCVRPTHLLTSSEHRLGNYFEIDAPTRNFLDGLLLGDGSYNGRNRLSAALTIGQRSDRIEWLQDIQKFLAKRGVPFALTNRPARTNRLGNQLIHQKDFTVGSTPAYRTLRAEYRRWYKRGRKRVPRDLDLSDPVLLAQWHMGDGNVYVPKNRGVQELALNTQGFPIVDVRWLVTAFAKQLGIQAFVKHTSIKRGRQPILAFSRHSAERFIELVRPYMCTVFAYKVPKPVERKERGKLLKLGHVKQTFKAWAKQTGLSTAVIHARLKRGWTVKQVLTAPGWTRIKSPSRYTAWSKQTGLRVTTIRQRLQRGWTVEQALNIPASLTKPHVRKRKKQ